MWSMNESLPTLDCKIKTNVLIMLGMTLLHLVIAYFSLDIIINSSLVLFNLFFNFLKHSLSSAFLSFLTTSSQLLKLNIRDYIFSGLFKTLSMTIVYITIIFL